MRKTVIETVRRPEYTGERRCLPCTVANVCLAGIGAGLVATVGVWTGAPLVGAGVGLAAFALSLALVALRGYLVPGTPTLTKRYFPERLLGLFGKSSPGPATGGLDGNGGGDPDSLLTAAGVLESDGDGDYRLTDEFRAAWRRANAGDEADGIPALLEDDEFDLEGWGDAFRVYLDDRMVGKWRSRAAFTVDAASAAALSARVDGWGGLSIEDRARLLERVRTRFGTCPDCGGETRRTTETVEGCCSTHEAATVSCRDCATRLYIETCPDCGGLTEYSSETVECFGDPIEIATRACTDCASGTVFATAPMLSEPPSEAAA